MEKVIETNGSVTSNSILNHQVIRKNNLLTLEKLNSREIYNIMINGIPHTPTSKRYFEQLFTEHILDWKEIYLLSRDVTLDCYSRSSKYKILNNIFFLNKTRLRLGTPIHYRALSANCMMEQ